MSGGPIYVTQPDMPPLDEFIPYLQQIWDRKVLTNSGPLHQQFEQRLGEYLGIEHISLFNNGTIALLVALRALNVTGEVITTPYSFVATAHSLLWNNLTPVFVDIDPRTLNLDPAKIETAITPQTTAIMPVHCYGNPCDVEVIKEIADRHNLRVIYDAAHAFGVQDAGGSILRHGDLSVLSFHATKVFNTFEGGAIVCPDEKTKAHIDQLKNFGFIDETTVASVGINGKMSEFNAAFGLAQLPHINDVIRRRKKISELYREVLRGVEGISALEDTGKFKLNYSYFPVFVEPSYSLSRDELYRKLKNRNIFARRYFYPLITNFLMYQGMPSARHADLPMAVSSSRKVLCLPIYPALTDTDVMRIVGYLR